MTSIECHNTATYKASDDEKPCRGPLPNPQRSRRLRWDTRNTTDISQYTTLTRPVEPTELTSRVEPGLTKLVTLWLTLQLGAPRSRKRGAPYLKKFANYPSKKSWLWRHRTVSPGKDKLVETNSSPPPLRVLFPVISKGFRNNWQIGICQLIKRLVDLRGGLIDFWGGLWVISKKKFPEEWFRGKKACQGYY